MSMPNFDLRHSTTTTDAQPDEPEPQLPPSAESTSSWQRSLGIQSEVTKLNLAALLLHFSSSILFLVLLNSLQPLYIAQLDAQQRATVPDRTPPELRIGALTGRLIFADEVASIVLVLLWGALADRCSIGLVATLGYCFVSLGIMAYALATKPWPDLLWARLLFAVGGSAVTAMLTASLAAYADTGAAAARETTGQSDNAIESSSRPVGNTVKQRHGRLASLAGTFTGLGAIVAVFALLPLPVWLASLHEAEDGSVGTGGPEDRNVQKATRETFLIVACLALVVAAGVAIGLKDPEKKQEKTSRERSRPGEAEPSLPSDGQAAATPREARRERLRARQQRTSMSQRISSAKAAVVDVATGSLRGFRLAADDKSGQLTLAYLGGALARGVTLSSTVFLPLLISHFFYVTDPTACPPPTPGIPPSELKKTCRQAYTLTSAQSGVLQTVALIVAPIVGLLSDRVGHALTLQVGSLAALAGFLMYGVALPGEGDPRSGTAWGAAVLLGIVRIDGDERQILVTTADPSLSCVPSVQAQNICIVSSLSLVSSLKASLTPSAKTAGAIAGAYSSTGALSILLFSSIGGWLFDLRPDGPFLILAGASGVVALWGGFVLIKQRISNRGGTIRLEGEE